MANTSSDPRAQQPTSKSTATIAQRQTPVKVQDADQYFASSLRTLPEYDDFVRNYGQVLDADDQLSDISLKDMADGVKYWCALFLDFLPYFTVVAGLVLFLLPRGLWPVSGYVAAGLVTFLTMFITCAIWGRELGSDHYARPGLLTSLYAKRLAHRWAFTHPNTTPTDHNVQRQYLATYKPRTLPVATLDHELMLDLYHQFMDLKYVRLAEDIEHRQQQTLTAFTEIRPFPELKPVWEVLEAQYQEMGRKLQQIEEERHVFAENFAQHQTAVRSIVGAHRALQAVVLVADNRLLLERVDYEISSIKQHTTDYMRALNSADREVHALQAANHELMHLAPSPSTAQQQPTAPVSALATASSDSSSSLPPPTVHTAQGANNTPC